MANTRKSPQSNDLPAHVRAVIGRHAGRGDRLVAGLSGGIDSIVLLDVLRRVAIKQRFELVALHVNHQINPAAAQWARFCRAYCRRLGVPLTVVKVVVPREASLEAAARNARYAAFAALPADFVVLAHNLDDQAETVLLQLLRGAGVKGASAMPVLRKVEGEMMKDEVNDKVSRSHAASPRGPGSSVPPAILRPLLEVPRSAIASYAAVRKLEWIEDDSNANVDFDRNFLRHRVLPVIAERYPAYRRTLARAGRNFAEAAALLHELAQRDAQVEDARIDIAALRKLTAPRARNALRFFLDAHGARMPSAARLAECLRQLTAPRATHMAIDLGAHELRRYGGELSVVVKTIPLRAEFCRGWQGGPHIAVPEMAGKLLMKKSRGAGISLAKLQAAPVTLRTRKGGERLRPDARRPRRSLKNLLQEARLPPWQRERLPLLFCGDSLVYVPGIGIDADFSARAGEPAIQPLWKPTAAKTVM